jgi:hypothetical protein
MNYVQIGIPDTATLGWIGQAYPSLSFRDDMKYRITKMMKSDCGAESHCKS